jgi:sphingolipid delta-4 desaturase
MGSYVCFHHELCVNEPCRHTKKSPTERGDIKSSKLTPKFVPSSAGLATKPISQLQVTKLCGPEPLTKWIVLLVVSIQVSCAVLLRNTPILSWPFFLTAYIVGATANQNLFLAIHEISHNLAFRKPLYNRLLAIFANLPIGVPYSAAFRPYHLIHHKSLGVEGLDTDLPTKLEAVFLDSILGKTFFCTFQILFYALRPMAVFQLPFTHIHGLNLTVEIAFDCLIVKYFGWHSMVYFLMSSFLAGSLHPTAGHFISEHVRPSLSPVSPQLLINP